MLLPPRSVPAPRASLSLWAVVPRGPAPPVALSAWAIALRAPALAVTLRLLTAAAPLVVAAPLLLLSACGSNDPPPTHGGQAGTSNDVLHQVLDECTEYAARLCQAAQPCCEQTATFAQDDCVATYVEKVCTPSAQLVAAGLATYDATLAEACLAAHQRAYDSCVVDWEETVAIRRELWQSCRVVDGTVAEGQHCDNDARCALPEGEATAACVQGICRKIELLAEGAPCPYPNGDVSTCDVGLYCTAETTGATGTCVAVTPAGESCDTSVLSNMECGLGSYCDLEAGVCEKATNFGGPSCTQGTECVSFLCDRVAQRCAEPLSTAASLCGAP